MVHHFEECVWEQEKGIGLQQLPRLQPRLTLPVYFGSRQPWSAYAVHLTTLSPPALLGDLLLVWLCHKATAPYGELLHDRAMTALYVWMFTSKWIKLLGHYIRYPVDVFLLPVSILFGYFHGAIKMYAVMTLNVVSCIVILFLGFCFIFLSFQFLFSFLRVNERRTRRKGKKKVVVLAASGLSKRQLPMTRQHRDALITTPPSCSRPYPLLFPCEPFWFPWLIHASHLPDAFSVGNLQL